MNKQLHRAHSSCVKFLIPKQFQIFLLSLAFLLTGFFAQATHYRYGTISWERVLGGGGGNACVVEVTVKQAWRASAWFGGAPTLGVSTASTGSLLLYGYNNGLTSFHGSNSIVLTATSYDAADDWFFGEFTTTVTLPNCTDSFAFYYDGCCRISSLVNNNDDDYSAISIVTPYTSGNDAPVSSQVPIVNVPAGVAAYNFGLSGTDPDGDPLSFRVATAAETGDGVGSSHPDFSVSPGGTATFNSMGKAIGGLYNVWYVVEDNNGALVTADFIIEIVGASSPPAFDYAVTPQQGNCFEVQPGVLVQFDVQADDTDPGSTVSLNAVGVPAGATHSPSLPTSPANPAMTSFSWTPTAANLGTTVITYTAEDNVGVQTSTQVCINVTLDPIFQVPPTPNEVDHNVVEPGTLISFPVEAYDPDPLDVVSINVVTGKDYATNTPVPLYAGASLAPFPTPTANPTSGTFSWTPGASDWGHRHVIFTAEDSYSRTTDHEVPILVNTPPFFNFSPALTAQAGQLYSQVVVADDADIPEGDSLELYDMVLPSWLNFTDNEDGTGLLSGTPTSGDVGMHNVMLEAEDVFHHNNGTATSSFMIEVIDTGDVDTTDCDPFALEWESDSTWMQSTTIIDPGWGDTWSGVASLPAMATYTVPVSLGQPYPWGTFEPVGDAPIIIAPNKITFYRKEISIPNPTDVKMLLDMTMDDGAEIYINGTLLVRENNSDPDNWKAPAHSILWDSDGTTTNGYSGGQMWDVVNPVDLDTVLVAGTNEVVVALFNLKASFNKGGFSMDLMAEVQCPDDTCVSEDLTVVSDSMWTESTVVELSSSGDWYGVASLPGDATFTQAAQVGQPYAWNNLHVISGTHPIKADNNIRFFRRSFTVADPTDATARIRMFMDDDVEIYVNGHLLAREENIDPQNFKGAYHDILFPDAAPAVNAFDAGQGFDYFVPAVDMDTVLVPGTNTVTLALRNLRNGANKGGFSFAMDIATCGEVPASVIPKNALYTTVQIGGVELYPNPTSGLVTVALPEIIGGGEHSLRLFDVNGRMLLERQESSMIGGSLADLDLSNLPAGIYILRVQSGDQHYMEKISKE